MGNDRRKIAVLTGTRAEYGLLRPLIAHIHSSDTYTLQLIVTGMHLSHQHGFTKTEVEKEFPVSATVNMLPKDDSHTAYALAFGQGVQDMSLTLKKLQPDILIVLGDRSEPYAAATAADPLSISVVHIHGGDTSGGLDDKIRDRISLSSSLHFAASRTSAERIEQLGINKDTIHVTGAPGLDSLRALEIDRHRLFSKYHITKSENYVLIIYHPLIEEAHDTEKQMQALLQAVSEKNIQALVVYPNNDIGNEGIIAATEQYQSHTLFQCIESLPHEEFLGLLKYTAALLGNSSSGIIEAPFFHIPVLNIGNRQKGRERSTNVIDCDPKLEDIKIALERVLDPQFKESINNCPSPYGDGYATEKMVALLDNFFQHRQ